MPVLRLSGSDPPPAIRELATQPGIEVTGFVEDVRPYLGRASLSLSPMTAGGGVKSKVLQSLAMATPVVTNERGARGTGLEPGRDLLVEETDEAMAEACVALLRDPRRRRRWGTSGRAVRRRRHGWDAVGEALEAFHEPQAPGAVERGRDDREQQQLRVGDRAGGRAVPGVVGYRRGHRRSARRARETGSVVLDVGLRAEQPAQGLRHPPGFHGGQRHRRRRDSADDRTSRRSSVVTAPVCRFKAGTFDLVLSKTAIEHMAAPEEFFAGVHYVLKPGGVFIWATSNLQSLPILASRMTPLGLHRWVYRHIFGKQLAIEQFPVYYRANTERAIERQLVAAGFERVVLYKTSWPCYFAFNRPLFSLMLPIHRWVDGVGSDLLRVHLTGVYRKR